MRKYHSTRKGILGFLMFFIAILLPMAVLSSWSVDKYRPRDISANYSSPESVVPVAYKAGATKTYYDSIPHALSAATSGDIIVVIPAKNKNYHSTSNPNGTIDKKNYTIDENCTIKSGVTLVIPTDEDTISGVTNSTTLTNYIKSMKEDDHSRGSGYGAYATSNETRFLRVTVTISQGVKLTNKGTLIVSGYLNSGTSNGGLVGNTSHSFSKIILDTNAQIEQTDAAAITYCYGYIQEKTVNNNSKFTFESGKLYLPFILNDYRGFSLSWAMTYNSSQALSTYHCSAFNQFEFINIDCLAVIKYGVQVLGNISIYLSYSTQNIDQCFPKEINIVGTANNYLCQLSNSTYSRIEYKYSRSTKISKIHLYGGASINYLSLSLSASIVSVNLSTNNSYFPISYRQNIELSKAENQSSATFSFSNQMLKFLPGSEMIINNGVTLTGGSLICYSAFYDGSLGNGYSSANGYNSYKYPIKNGAVLKVKSGGHLTCSNSLAGTIYANSSDVSSPTTTSITSNEPWNVASSGSINPAWKISDYLEIKESLQLLPLSDANKQRLCVGINTFKNYNSYRPSVQVTINSGLDSEEMISVSQSQKVIHASSISNYNFEFVANVYKAYVNTSNYIKDSTITYNATNSNCCMINSTMSISNDNNGVNEFDVQSVTVTCATPMVDGHYPLYPETSVQLTTNIVDIEKAYNKTVVWSSSNDNIATVSQTGVVTGVQVGNVRITATCDGVSGYIDLEVIEEPSAVVGISSIYIRDNKGHTSEGEPTIQSSDRTFKSHAQYSNKSNITFTVVINPSDAPYASIKWTFNASAAGRQYMNDKTLTTETAENVSSVVIHIVSGSGGDDDSCSLKCEVTDLTGSKFTNTFKINHKKDVSVCVTENALITIADGRQVKASDIHLGDLLKTWSFEKGDWAIEPVIFLEKKKNVEVNVITLTLEDKNSIDISWGQGFFDTNSLDYFVIDDDNYQESVGRTILTFENNKPIGKKIISATAELKVTSTYEIHTGHGFQFVANNILTIEPLINQHVWFTVNDNFKYDEELMKQDIEKYGVLPYEVFSDYVTEEQYDLFNGKYLAVPIGKGYFTLEQLMQIIADFIPDNT